MKRPQRLGVAALAAAALVASATGACTANGKEATPTVPVPKVYESNLLDDVAYPEGKPTGKYEDDPWVRIIHSYEAEYQWARAHHDWTNPNLLMTVDAGELASSAGWQILEAEQGVQKWSTPAGPLPFKVLSIEPWNNGRGAMVTVCQAYYWYMSSTNEAPVLEADGRQVEYLMTIDEEDGYGKVVMPAPDDDKPCSVEGIVPSYFDPLPTYTEISPDDVKITPWIERELDRSK